MGFYAYTALCTHERCLIDEPDAMGVSECVCHGSRFDGEGRDRAAGRRRAAPPRAPRLLGRARVRRPQRGVAPRHEHAGMPTWPTPTRGTSDGIARATRGRRARDRPDIDPCTLGVDVGAVGDFAAASWTLQRDRNLIVGRDAMGLFAYSARCPHQDCTVRAPDREGVGLPVPQLALRRQRARRARPRQPPSSRTTGCGSARAASASTSPRR